ncbi:MAG: recombination protein NinG [Pseudomonadota bacterium]
MTEAVVLKACVVCGKDFEPISRRHSVCGEQCAIDLAGHKRREAARKQAKREAEEARRQYRASRKPAKNHDGGGLYTQARQAINGFVRERDYDKPCIVHGTNDPNDFYDAGHFIGVEVTSALRFNLWNIHKQKRSSNRGAHYRKKYRDTTPAKYEANLVKRIGQARVDWLKGPHEPREYSDEWLCRAADIFRRRARLYRRLREARSTS